MGRVIRILFLLAAVVLIVFAGLFYFSVNTVEKRIAFVNSLVLANRPYYLEDCVRTTRQSAGSLTAELEKKIDETCACHYDLLMLEVVEHQKSLQEMLTATYRVYFESDLQRQISEKCLQRYDETSSQIPDTPK